MVWESGTWTWVISVQTSSRALGAKAPSFPSGMLVNAYGRSTLSPIGNREGDSPSWSESGIRP